MSVIKFHKVPEPFPNRKVRTEQLWDWVTASDPLTHDDEITAQ